MRRPLVPLLALALLGCADKTAILVEVTSNDLAVPADVDALRFTVTSDGGHHVDQTFGIDGTWPQTLSVLPAGPEDTSVVLSVTGLRENQPRVRRVVSVAFERGTTRHVSVVLTRDCLDVMCGEGVDCAGGMCAGQPMLDGGVDGGGTVTPDAGHSDAGIDASTSPDAGAADGGAADGGAADGGVDGGVLTPDAGPPDAGPPDAGPIDAGPPPVLIFSEYIEGSSNNKALEIANLGPGPADLSACTLRRYTNGTTAPFDIALSGTLAEGDVFVVCNGGIEMPTLCDLLTGSVSHNGNDAYDLFCGGMVVDTFGQIGFDPGSSGWTSASGLSSVDHDLRRQCTVTTGDTNGIDAFDPSVEWMGSAWVDAATSLTGLGNRSECP